MANAASSSTAAVTGEAPFQLNEAQNVAYLPVARAVVSGLPVIGNKGGRPVLSADAPGGKPSLPAVRRYNEPGDSEVIFWGDNNTFPQDVIAQASKSTIIPRAMTDIAALLLGGGLIATADEESTKMVKDREIRDFLRNITTKRYLHEAALDMAWWWNGFPELILSKDRSKIVQLHSNETSDCRWGRANADGVLDTVHLNANWNMGASWSSEDTIKLPAINPYRYDRVDYLRGQKSVYKAVYPISFPSPGKSHYQLAAWDSARSSGWLDVLGAIPQFKKYALQNQMTLRYHIEVPASYWEKVYGEKWLSGSDAEKIQIRDTFLTSLMDKLTGVENANKGILTESWYDWAKNKEGITINVLDDKTKDNKFQGDYSEGIANLLYSLGVDPTLFGFSAEGVGSNGGSNKREAFWIFLTKAGPFRDRLLEPLQFVAEYNGWMDRYPDLTFSFQDTLLTTLDTGKSTQPVNTPANP